MATESTASLRTLDQAGMTLADRAADVRGRKVVARDGQEIGTVDALLIDDRDEKVRFLRVAAGGFLGIGERRFLIPVDAVTRVDPETVHVDQTRDRIVGSPAYDPKVVPQDRYWNDLYGYYGYAPYWAPGYVYPPYPSYP